MADTPAPQVKRNAGTPDQLPYGAAKQVNDAMVEVDDSELYPVSFFPEEQAEDDFSIDGDLTGLDHRIFAPTDRPSEPITAGAPFGAGPSLLRHSRESDGDFRARVAREIANSPHASGRVKAWAARLARGE